MTLPPPTAFGLPPKFNSWRANQSEACEEILDSDTRFLMQVLGTGSGKSGVYVAAANMLEGRTCILTSTKGLQSQLMNDFGDIAVDVRGKGNYVCRLNTKMMCDAGACAFGVRCSMKEEGGCPYYDRVKLARRSKIVITNYAYWMNSNEFGEGLGKFDMLVLDEAHAAPDHIIDHISTTFSRNNRIENRMLGLEKRLPQNAEEWALLAYDRLGDVKLEVENAKMERKEKKYLLLKRLEQKLDRVATGINSSWVWEDGGINVKLSPVWPSPFAETSLFLGIPKVVPMSATVVPKTAQLLGVPGNELTYTEYPHMFPAENRQLIHTPTVRMNHKNGEVEERLWLAKVDSIIRGRIGWKGIIHTGSYQRRDLVVERSRYSQHMITHNRRNTESVVETFKRSSAPCILVSPSITTGYDFPGDEARWQIIIKLPYPDIRGAITRARMKEDDEYIPYVVMQDLIQAVGRSTRSDDDYAETFILDNNIQWFLKKYKHLAVEWFWDAYRVSPTIPDFNLQ